MPSRLVLAVSFLATALPLSAQTPGKRYALLVGVNEYNKPGFTPLKYAEADAKELAAVLKADGYEVTLLLGSAAGSERATRENVEAAVGRLLKVATQRDTLLIGLAGHGSQFKPTETAKEEAYFCPVDAVRDTAGSLVSLTKLLRDLDREGGGTNLLLVDACRDNPDPSRGRGI